MAEELIAEHRWRRRVRDWSGICDNALRLDRTTSLDESPMKLNRYGLCPPPCEMCVTPFPQLGNLDLLCSLRAELGKYMVLPPPPPRLLPIPAQFDCEILTANLTSAIDTSNQNGGTNCFRIGMNLPNLLGRAQTTNFVMRGSEQAGFAGDWADFGMSETTLDFLYTEKWFPASHTNIYRARFTRKRMMQVRPTLTLRSPFLADCVFNLTIEYRPKVGSEVATDTRIVPDPANQVVRPGVDGINARDAYDRIWLPTVIAKPNSPSQNIIYQLNLQNRYVQEINQFQNQWDPFLYHQGLMACGFHELYEKVNWTVNITSLFGRNTTVSSQQTTPDKNFCYMLKLQKRGQN